jgi:hypothetical protein
MFKIYLFIDQEIITLFSDEEKETIMFYINSYVDLWKEMLFGKVSKKLLQNVNCLEHIPFNYDIIFVGNDNGWSLRFEVSLDITPDTLMQDFPVYKCKNLSSAVQKLIDIKYPELEKILKNV